MKTVFVVFLLLSPNFIWAQGAKISSVIPGQDMIGASRYTQVIVQLETHIDSFTFHANKLFQIYGSNSGLINGIVEADSNNNKFVFTPIKPLYCGEVVNVSFGPLIDQNNDTLISFHWRFTIEITNPTNVNYDSLSRFEYPSFDAVVIDFDNDSDIDIVTTGMVIYNNGNGLFDTYQEIEELINVKYLVDVNNDKIFDIITSSPESVNVFLGDGSGNYQLYQNIYSLGNIIFAKGDFNGDGFVDLIAKGSYGEFGTDFFWITLINDGAGKFIEDTNNRYLENYISEADLVDMDKDGDLDLVLLNTWPSDPSTQFDGAYLYYNDGQGNFNDSLKIRFNLYPYNEYLSDLSQLFIVDYDLNGLNDITGFGSQNGGMIVLQNPKNNFNGYVETAFAGAENLSFFTSGDINGDNRFDLIQSNWQVCLECGDTGKVRMVTFLNFDPIDFWSDSSLSSFNLGLRREVGVAVVPVLADVDNDGDLDIIHTGYPTTVTYNENVVTGVEELKQLSFLLSQNYPNPFNSITTITYTLPFQGHIKLSVFNVLGEQIKLLVNDFQNSGNHSVIFNASNLSSGLYLYRLSYNSKSIIKKMIYLK